jgi:hypothetical protein
MSRRGSPWSLLEVEATVSDYFSMLEKELRDEPYNKSAHRRALQPLLNDRSDGAIERKHQNVSSVLIEEGFPWIEGYKPLPNVQSLLRDVVRERLAGAEVLHDLASEQVTRQLELPALPAVDDLAGLLVDPPALSPSRAGIQLPEDEARERPHTYGQFPDYLQREANNRALGEVGERFVLTFEQARLTAAGREGLASDVEHVARTRGDGLGFDILSFESDGRERLIEVKTTGFGKEAPFWVTARELAVSRSEEERYHLYRAFSFRKSPRLFIKQGALDRVSRLEPDTFRGWVG